MISVMTVRDLVAFAAVAGVVSGAGLFLALLHQELRALRGAAEGRLRSQEHLRDEVDALVVREAAFRSAFVRYARHLPGCGDGARADPFRSPPACTCGLAALLDEVAESEAPITSSRSRS